MRKVGSVLESETIGQRSGCGRSDGTPLKVLQHSHCNCGYTDLTFPVLKSIRLLLSHFTFKTRTYVAVYSQGE